jgi:serine/threonine protein kinase
MYPIERKSGLVNPPISDMEIKSIHPIDADETGSPLNDHPVALPSGHEKVDLGSGTVTRLLGMGGMAAVYEIWNPHLEIHRAVKVMSPGSSKNDHERFQTETKICAKLSHPNIVEIHSVGKWQGLPYIEMELIDGIGCDRLLLDRGALPIATCIAISIMVCRALDYAHNQDYTIYGKKYHGVIHRDLKPQNIMICGNGKVKLMDFGIARPSEVSFHTMDDNVVGTLQYLAPEQLTKGRLDVRTDLYSLGVVMYEMLTGMIAFPQKDLASLIDSKIRNTFKSIDEYGISIPQQLKRIIRQCMQHDPEKRIPTAAALLHELEMIYEGSNDVGPEKGLASFLAVPAGSKVVLATHHQTHLRRIAAICVGVVAAAVVILFWSGYRHQKSVQKNHSGYQVQQPVVEKSKITDQPIPKIDSIVASSVIANQIPKKDSIAAPSLLVGKMPQNDLKASSSMSRNQIPKKNVTVTTPLVRSQKPEKGVTANPTMVSGQIPEKEMTANPTMVGSQIPEKALPSVISNAKRKVTTGPNLTLIDSLIDKYATDDLITIMEKEVVRKNYLSALTVYEALVPAQAQTPYAVILRIRALDKLEYRRQLAQALENCAIDDGEIYLAQAKLFYQNGNWAESKRLIDKCLSAPHAYIGFDILKRESYYYNALCSSVQFDAKPSQETYLEASAAWWQLKSELRSEPGHQYNSIAASELQRMAMKMKNVKG